MPSNWLAQLGGKFIVFDGPDGSGKSTQFKRFTEYCAAGDVRVCEVREPGGTAIGEQIRTVLLNPANTDMSLRCEMMLYMASRAQLIEQRIRPALDCGELVLADRFVSSTLAYQGAGGGLPVRDIMQVALVAINECWPDLVVVFDVDEQTAARRMAGSVKRNSPKPAVESSLFADRMELKGLDYQRRVRQGYLAQAQGEPAKYLVINAARDPDSVFADLVQKLEARFAAGS